MSVFYPNKLMVYLLPSMSWFLLTQFKLETILSPYFTLPHIVLATENYLREGLDYINVGAEGARNLIALLYPYVFIGLCGWLAIEIIRLALVRQWHFYDKE